MSRKNNSKRNRENNRRELQLEEAVNDPNPLKFTISNDAPVTPVTQTKDSNEVDTTQVLVERFKEIRGRDYYKK